MKKAERKTAKIYAFPAPGLGHRANRFAGQPRLQQASLPALSKMEFGSGWYHDAAIQNAPSRQKP